MYRTYQKKIVPDGIELYYGSAYIIATRDFIHWTTTDLAALNLINWSRDTFSPDEIIWATLSRIYQNQNPKTVIQTVKDRVPAPSPNLVWRRKDAEFFSDSVKPQLSYARAVKWEDRTLKWNAPYPVCQVRFSIFYPTGKFYCKETLAGSYRHAICVFGIGDLGWLLQQNQLFANKFDDRKDDLVLQCLEDWLKLREREEKECTDSTLF